MEIVLGANQYGKAEVRMVAVDRSAALAGLSGSACTLDELAREVVAQRRNVRIVTVHSLKLIQTVRGVGYELIPPVAAPMPEVHA